MQTQLSTVVEVEVEVEAELGKRQKLWKKQQTKQLVKYKQLAYYRITLGVINVSGQLAGHMLKHNGQYICPECNRRHITKHDLEEHIKISHKNEEQNLDLSCDVFGKDFPALFKAT